MSQKKENESPNEASVIKEKMKSFSELLDSIDSLEDKKKALWKEIYENAIMDRDNAHIMFMKLFDFVKDDSTQHAIHGTTISKYLERMNKSNDQLIKLAELIAAAENKNENIDSETLFDKISKSTKKRN